MADIVVRIVTRQRASLDFLVKYYTGFFVEYSQRRVTEFLYKHIIMRKDNGDKLLFVRVKLHVFQ